MFKKTLVFALTVLFVAGISVALAGHHYGGYHKKGDGCMGMNWNMTELDTNDDGVLSFEEFYAPNMEKWQSGFDMIDTNDDGIIDKEEHRKFLKVHGVDKS